MATYDWCFYRKEDMATYNEKGQEIPDPTPVEVPFVRPLTLQEEMKRFIRGELSRQMQDQGVESFEEADDFDIEEDADDFVSEYEVKDMVEDGPMGTPRIDPDPPKSPQDKTSSGDSGTGTPEPEKASEAVLKAPTVKP